ncbi:phage tail tube protein [Vreelandella profundi]|uniref:phage tail tube protein n=1 Tax=Vreelandella profundi TaxID=2852117 RepID=UPI001F1C38F7|nr:phage tail tube protein [Halomonas profundi]
MSVLTQGTHVFFKDPAAEGGATIVRLRKATAFNPGGNPADQIDDTDLEEINSRQYKRGLRTPGQASFTVNATPEEPSHIRLHELAEGGEDVVLDWYIGWADGTELPTLETGEVVLPTTRTWFTFRAYVSDFPFDFQTNALVATNCTLQRSGGGTWKPKEVTPAP